MINFNELRLVNSENYSFVGIKKEGESLKLYIPKGFSEATHSTIEFGQKRSLFFLLYRSLKEFREICLQKGLLENTSRLLTGDRDGIIRSKNGSVLKLDDNHSNIVFYSKLDLISNFLETYDEIRILSLNHKIAKSRDIDIGDIYKYLHKAVYLPNGAAYIDEMLLPKDVLEFDSNDVVLIYCYLYDEIKTQISEDVRDEVKVLSERFRQKYLTPQDGLFEEFSFERTAEILRDTLSKIHDFTATKDHDFWYFYESVEAFLYGDWSDCEEGEIWGINNFYSVWESMCLTYLVKKYGPSGSIFYIDSSYVKSEVLESFVDNQEQIRKNRKVFRINNQQLHPDVVIRKTLSHQIAKNIPNIEYSIRPNIGWNDYGYKTIIKGVTDDEIRVAYQGQDVDHSFDELKKTFADGNINRRLSNGIYSFWEIDEDENIDFLYLHKMMTFNHLFFLALEHNIRDWENFRIEILANLGANSQLRHNSPQANVFSHSLLRGFCVEGRIEKLGKLFQDFMRKTSEICNERFEIIDVKYLEEDYFSCESKISEIKKRSVRKQFVYEYLLEKYLDRDTSGTSATEVSSLFWLPFYSPSTISSLPGQTFMGNYIKIEKINFNAILDFYVSSK